jgi:hypothetical protein
MKSRRIHYVMPGRNRAICGANQGQKGARGLAATSDVNRVTCGSCSKGMHGAQEFSAELMARLHLGEKDGK